MMSSVHFIQSCPVCGRSLRIRVGLLGRQVYCGHCQGSFTASDPALASPTGKRPVLRPLAPLVPASNRPTDERIEELLERAGRQLTNQGSSGDEG